MQAADRTALEELELEISSSGMKGEALENLRMKRQQKLKSIAETGGKLAVSGCK